jgi:pyrimidine operon attenuation protein/uracil phosphoribosyltransferase
MLEAEALLESVAKNLRMLLAERGIDRPALVGIHTGGVWVAERLRRLLNIELPTGSLDISFYRDDFSRIGMHPRVRPSELPFDVDGRHIVLVDDVLHTGRTVRAALDEIFDYGRPDSVILVALVDRAGRELPIEGNVIGARLQLRPDENIKLVGPDPLQLELQAQPS